MKGRGKVLPLLLTAAILFGAHSSLYAESQDALFGDWGGVKDSLENHGISTEAVVTGDIMVSFLVASTRELTRHLPTLWEASLILKKQGCGVVVPFCLIQ